MGYGDDLLITALAHKIKKKFPGRQIVIGSAKKKRAYHSIVYDNNPNISDCRNLDNTKPIHIIDYHVSNRPYIDYNKSSSSKYIWKKFKPEPGQIFFSEEEKISAKKIIIEAKTYWKENNEDKYKGIIFLETSSTKLNDKQFGIKQRNKDWGEDNWRQLIDIIKKEFLIIKSIHNESKKTRGVYSPEKMDFRLACAVLNEADLYVGPEGGFGHVAAALNKKAVIYFGGWISPETIGYDLHENLFYKDKLSPCGEYKKLCKHCDDARKAISVDLFLKHINKIFTNL